jgi:hypothetical protein
MHPDFVPSEFSLYIHHINSLFFILYLQSAFICFTTMVVSLKLAHTHTCEKHSPHGGACPRCLQTLYYMSAPKTDLAPALLGPPPGLYSSPDSTNGIWAWLDGSCSTATPLPEPIPDPEVRLLPPMFSVYNHLLEEAGEGRWPVHREDEYISLMAQSASWREPVDSSLDNHLSWHYWSGCHLW